MVTAERKLNRKGRKDRNLAEKIGDPVFSAQHRAKFKAFRRLIKALRKNRKTNALKYKTKLVAKYPKMATELGVDKCNINTLLTDEKLREKLRKRINNEDFKRQS